MKLIVDSGSTKTDWIGVDENDSKVFETQTLGLNPQVLTSNIIKERVINNFELCLLYTSPSPRDRIRSRMPSSA